MNSLARRHHTPPGTGLHELETELEHLRFALVRLGEGALELDLGDEEGLLVLLEAPEQVALTCDGREFVLPPRRDVFRDGPSALFAPAGTRLCLSGTLLAALFRARADESELGAADLEPYRILPEEVTAVRRGRGNFQRDVRDILPRERPATRLLAGETLNPPGNWSSSPPHKHDFHDPPKEVALEEVYLFRVDPPQGFGLQLSYSTDPPAEAPIVVRDLDAVSIPSGFHPVVAGPGYGLYYLWCLAGRGRELIWRPDPAHAWVEHG